jgi:hypothetical protein
MSVTLPLALTLPCMTHSSHHPLHWTHHPRLQFPMGRLKTGTPARLLSDTIDYTGLEKQFSDHPPVPFSALNVHRGVAQKDNLGITACLCDVCVLIICIYMCVCVYVSDAWFNIFFVL